MLYCNKYFLLYDLWIVKISLLGILISGGYHASALASAEVFIPALNRSCSLPYMTTTRYGHSQNNLLACGGYGSRSTCEVFTPGVGWRPEPYSLESCGRSYHTSWTLNNGSVLLLGGGCWSDENTTVLITPGVGTKPGFSLEFSIK